MPPSSNAIQHLVCCTMVVALSAGFTGCGGEIVIDNRTPPPSRTETIAELKELMPAIALRAGEDEFNSDRRKRVCDELNWLLNAHGNADPPVLTERELQLLDDALGSCDFFPDDARRTLRRLISEMERRDAAQE